MIWTMKTRAPRRERVQRPSSVAASEPRSAVIEPAPEAPPAAAPKQRPAPVKRRGKKTSRPSSAVASDGAATELDVVVGKQALVRAMDLCQRVGDRKSSLVMLGYVRLDARERTLDVAGTDLTVAVRKTLPARSALQGAITLNAGEARERLKRLKGTEIRITVREDRGATLKAVGADRGYTLRGLPVDKFPALPKPGADSMVRALDPRALAQLIARTAYAMSNDESRAHLNGALFEWQGQDVRMVATDGHRLAKMEIRVGKGQRGDWTMLLPSKGVRELGRLCAQAQDAAENIEVIRSGAHAFFRFPDMLFGTRLIDAQFPPYEKVIPSAPKHSARFSRSEMTDALKAVSVAASKRTGGVRLALEKRAVRLASESAESGAAFDKVAAEYDGPPVAIGLNARYLLDALGAMDADEVLLGVSGELDPALLRPAAAARGEYTAVVMPMRV